MTTTLKALGFCGVDDSVDPSFLGIISNSYPFVEFGVLFRPDKEGQPRYATKAWVQKLAVVQAKSSGSMRLAAHLCGSRVHEILNGNDEFVSMLETTFGFQRIQINATVVNGVNTSNLDQCISSVASVMSRHPKVEFILQKNEETAPLWEGLLLSGLPRNATMLIDESKGTGVLSKSWPKPPDQYDVGYAGGIGPDNIHTVLDDLLHISSGRDIWIDMESSLRSIKNGVDVFDLDKCYECIQAVCRNSSLIQKHPSFLE